MSEWLKLALLVLCGFAWMAALGLYRIRRAPDPEWLRKLLHMGDRKSTRLNSSHIQKSRMPSSA